MRTPWPPLLPTAFRVASFVRGARAFHPRGAVFEADWLPGGEVAAVQGTPLGERRRALVRLSHGVGLPAVAPDIQGLAVKVADAHGPGRDQDLLLASTGRGRLGRHVLVPRRRLVGSPLSTILPYEIDGLGRRPVVALARRGQPPTTYAQALDGPPSRVPAFELRLGAVDGPLLATVVPGERIHDEVGERLRFDPWHTGDQLRPVGWLNRVRGPTYAASQRGRLQRTPARDRVGR